MKSELLLRWLLLPATLRWLSLAGVLFGVALATHRFAIVPARTQQQQAQHDARQQRQHYQHQLAALLQQSGLSQLQLRNQQQLEAMVRDGEPFSLYTLLQHSGGELEQWRPGGRESQLRLRLSWPQLKQIFAYLAACEPTPTVTAFTVQRQDARLHATFLLAFDDEISLH
ncbi:hypothetical protein [Mixta gaviniae]|uniref:DNA utilization protein HofO C-terminal domain-containing protein n=1 Tax=Mixta gaviniae TaxID=665914 RepID=A0A2L0IBH4_9GAMM|nr:hypothetical protein [Mixta gaviniae]AUX91958.1 hypothetical protein C2E15_01805 [Mixta gaviniae]